MERTPEHIDDIFRKRLHDAAVPPPAFVWENVERELRKKKRRFFFWIFSLGLGSAGILGLWWASALSHEEIAPIAQSTRIEETTATVSENQISAAVATDKPRASALPQHLTVKAENVRFVQQKTPAATTTRPAQLSLNKANLHTAKTFVPVLPTVATLSTESTPAAPESQPQKTFLEVEHVPAESPLVILAPDIPLQIVSGNATVQAAALSVRNTWPVDLKSKAAKPLPKKPLHNCYDFSKQPSAWLIEAYFGPSLAQRELVSSPDDRPYLNKRLSTEHRNVAFNAGVRASLMLKGNFLLRTGVHYDQMTEIFEYIDPEFVRTIVENVYHPSTGLTTLDTVGVEYGEKYQKTFNRFGMLDIPVVVGMELRKGRSGFNINAGVSFNMLFWKRGAIISPDTGEPVWFTPNQQNGLAVFRPRTGLSATASVQWFYHLKPRLRVFVEPYFKKVLRPVTLSAHPVEQRYGIGGLRFGLTKILN